MRRRDRPAFYYSPKRLFRQQRTNAVPVENGSYKSYMNAVLQSLIADRGLVHTSTRRLKSCISDSMPLTGALLAMVNTRPYLKVMNTEEIEKIFVERYSWFKTNSHHDAQDFLKLFMYSLEQEFISQQPTEGQESIPRNVQETKSDVQRRHFSMSPKKFLKRRRTVRGEPSIASSPRASEIERTKELPGSSLGYFLSQKYVLICPSCGKQTFPPDRRELGLSVSIPENPKTTGGEVLKPNWNLETLIWQSFEAELVARRCVYCTSVSSIVERVLTETPRCLIVRIKRFNGDGEKIDNAVKIPESLSLDIFFPPKAAFPCQYKLYSVVRCSTDQARGGHFVADVLEDDGTWTRCDDNVIIPGYTDTRDEREGYLCFYNFV